MMVEEEANDPVPNDLEVIVEAIPLPEVEAEPEEGDDDDGADDDDEADEPDE